MITIVAEIGINHNGDMENVRKLIGIACAAGCDYVKFQKRTPEVCVPVAVRNIPRETPWGTMPYIEYRERMELDEGQYQEIDDLCKRRGIKWFASVWDMQSAQFMANRGLWLVKVPSAKLTDLNLLRACRSWFETFILSTGMSTQEEIDKAVEIGKPDYLLHTHSAYPAPIHELDLTYIPELKRRYRQCIVGYSGHEYGLIPSFAAAALGAQMIERHITLDRTMWGSDQLSSIEPIGLFKLVNGIRAVELAISHKEAPEGCSNGRVVLPSEQPKRDALRG